MEQNVINTPIEAKLAWIVLHQTMLLGRDENELVCYIRDHSLPVIIYHSRQPLVDSDLHSTVARTWQRNDIDMNKKLSFVFSYHFACICHNKRCEISHISPASCSPMLRCNAGGLGITVLLCPVQRQEKSQSLHSPRFITACSVLCSAAVADVERSRTIPTILNTPNSALVLLSGFFLLLAGEKTAPLRAVPQGEHIKKQRGLLADYTLSLADVITAVSAR